MPPTISDDIDDSNDQPPQLSLGQALSRGIRLCCPICGRGRLFRGWFKMHRECSRCGFVFERAAGYFLGSTYINYGVTAGLATVSYVVLRFAWGVHRETLLPAVLGFSMFFPLVFFRFARSLWLSLDCYVDRIGASEARVQSSNETTRSEVPNNGS